MGGFIERGGLWVATQVVLFVAIVVVGRLDLASFEWGPAVAVGWGLMAAGVAVGGASALSLGRNLTPYPKPIPAGSMVVRGPYRVVRHPIYSAVITGMLGVAVRAQDWLAIGLALALIPFFYAKSTFEEQHLVEQYPGYAEYRTAVPRRLLPGLL